MSSVYHKLKEHFFDHALPEEVGGHHPRVFVAGSSKIRAHIRWLIFLLRENGYTVYDWPKAMDEELRALGRANCDFFLGRSKRNAQDILFHSAAMDVGSASRADVFVWVCDERYASRGAAFEAGVACTLGIPVIVYSLGDPPDHKTGALYETLFPRVDSQDELLEAIDEIVGH